MQSINYFLYLIVVKENNYYVAYIVRDRRRILLFWTKDLDARLYELELFLKCAYSVSNSTCSLQQIHYRLADEVNALLQKPCLTVRKKDNDYVIFAGDYALFWTKDEEELIDKLFQFKILLRCMYDKNIQDLKRVSTPYNPPNFGYHQE